MSPHIQYHLINPDELANQVIQSGIEISEDERIILMRMVEASVEVCGQLQRDIELTLHLLSMLEDWLEVYHINNIRLQQQEEQENGNSGMLHIH